VAVTNFPEMSRSHHWAVLGGVYVAALCGAYESVGLGTLFPFISQELSASDNIVVYVTSFGCAGFISTVLTGQRVRADNYVRLFLLSSSLQVLGLLVCLLALENISFVVGRVLQGAGEGSLTVLIFFALTQFPTTDRTKSKALAGFSIAWLVPSLLSPVLFVFLPAQAAWRPVLAMLIVLSITSVATVSAGRRAIRSRPVAPPEVKAGVSARQTTALIAGALLIGGYSLVAQAIPGFISLTAGVVLLTGLTYSLWGGHLGVLGRSPLALLGGLTVRGAVSSIYFSALGYLPLVMATVYARGGLEIAVCLGVAAVGWTAGAFVQSNLTTQDPLKQMSLGMGMVAAGIASPAVTIGVGASWYLVVPAVFFAGIGIGMTTNLLPVFLARVAGPSGAGEALSASETIDTIWSTMIITIVGVILIPSISSPFASIAVAVVYAFLALAAIITAASILLIGSFGKRQQA
jgi:MFS family permease